MNRSDMLKMPQQRLFHNLRKHGQAVLVALAVTDHDLIGREVDVLDAQTKAFPQTQSSTVHQTRHKPLVAFEVAKNQLDLIPRHYHR